MFSSPSRRTLTPAVARIIRAHQRPIQATPSGLPTAADKAAKIDNTAVYSTASAVAAAPQQKRRSERCSSGAAAVFELVISCSITNVATAYTWRPGSRQAALDVDTFRAG